MQANVVRIALKIDKLELIRRNNLSINSVRFLTTQLVSEMGYASGLHRQVLFSVGLVLFVFIMIINLTLMKLKKKGAVEND